MKTNIKNSRVQPAPLDLLAAALEKVPQERQAQAARDAAIFVAGFRSGLEHQTAHALAPRQTASA